MSAQKSTTRVVVEIVVAVIVLSLVFVWSESMLSDKVGPGDAPRAATREPGPALAGVAEARAADLPVVVEILGTVRPVRDAVVAARVMGVVSDVGFEEGDRVRGGQVLVAISAEELGARSRAARQQVAAGASRLEQARRDLARTEALHAREAATRVELERARTSVSVAEAELAAARQAAHGEATVAAYSDVVAPFDGRVLERHVDPGDLAAPGTPLMSLEADGHQRLEVAVDERLSANLAVGDAVTVTIETLGESGVGTVAEIEPEADAASRTVLVRVELPPSVRDRGVLRTGTFGRARLVVGRRVGVVAPVAALRRVGGLATVRVLDGERQLVRHVRAGAELDGGLVELLSGVQPGDLLVIEATEAGS